MKNSVPNSERPDGERGQVMVLFVLLMVVLILFIGLGVDLGFSYITRANLSKAVDAAALMGASSLAHGTNNVEAIAFSAFELNYGVSGRDAAAPAVVVQTFTDANNNQVVDVSATVNINTFFIRLLPQWSTLPVAASAEAVRDNVIMTLVLDTSGSMDPSRGSPPGGDGTGSGGGQYLPGAVTSFINNFDETHDKAAVVSFASIQQDIFFGGTPPQPTSPFKSQITSVVNAFVWTNSTFSQGGLTNALVLENNASVPSGRSVVKIVVFCTDGLANVVQDTLDCSPPRLWNFGGQDPPLVGYDLIDPVTGNKFDDSDCSATEFRSAIDGSMKELIATNISADATFRAVQVSQQMRASGIIVYSIGVGTGVNLGFLQQVANDPALAGTPGYAPTSFDGQAVVANDVTQLSEVFQEIASKILLRLSK